LLIHKILREGIHACLKMSRTSGDGEADGEKGGCMALERRRCGTHGYYHADLSGMRHAQDSCRLPSKVVALSMHSEGVCQGDA